MCDSGNRAEVTPAETLPASLEWKGEVLPLEPVDELSVLTVCDNVTDILLPDQGPAKRLPLAAMGSWHRCWRPRRYSGARRPTCRWPSTGSPRW